MVQAENLVMRFGVRPALRGISFHVKRGERVGFLGPNGAGKTTTLRILTGFLQPSSGSVRISGLSLDREGLRVRRSIGYLPERVPLYPDMRVSSYLRFVAGMKGWRGVEAKRRADEAIETCGVSAVIGRRIGVISHGYRQRVGLAQAVLGNPDLLILDEPTAGLDPEQASAFGEILRKLPGGKTVLLSTHILPEASRLCERILILDRGLLIADGTPERLESSLRTMQVIHLTVSGPVEVIRYALERVPGVRRALIAESGGETASIRIEAGQEEEPRSGIARAVIEAGGEVIELSRASMSLEEIYLRLTGEGKTG